MTHEQAYAAGKAKGYREAARALIDANNRINPARHLVILEVPMSLAHDITTIIDAYNALKAENAALKQQLAAAQPSAEDVAAEQQLASVTAGIAAEGQPAAQPAAPVEQPAPATTAAPAGPTLMSQVS